MLEGWGEGANMNPLMGDEKNELTLMGVTKINLSDVAKNITIN